MYKCLRYLKVNGQFIDKGENVDLSNLSAQEITRLEKKGIVEKTNGATGIAGTTVGGAEKSAKGVVEDIDKIDVDNSEEMTDEEVRVELLEKISHTVAVKELKLLGAEFKANAPLKTLVELIMEKEEYENHFLDYIENNGL